MKVIEFNDDDFREIFDDEYDSIKYIVDNMRIQTLTNFLGYQMRTDGKKVYAVNGQDIIEIGLIEG